MLCYDLRAIEAKAVTVDDTLSADDPVWIEGDPMPEGAVQVHGRLSTAGAGRVYFSGRLSGATRVTCRRCLADLSVPLDDEVQLVFADDELGDDADGDVYPIDPGAVELDLRPAIREEWVLAAPAFALCRPDCQGLCAQCGADKNLGPCQCATRRDPRWDALSALPRDDAQ
jgi:uncharacterized protein